MNTPDEQTKKSKNHAAAITGGAAAAAMGVGGYVAYDAFESDAKPKNEDNELVAENTDPQNVVEPELVDEEIVEENEIVEETIVEQTTEETPRVTIEPSHPAPQQHPADEPKDVKQQEVKAEEPVSYEEAVVEKIKSDLTDNEDDVVTEDNGTTEPVELEEIVEETPEAEVEEELLEEFEIDTPEEEISEEVVEETSQDVEEEIVEEQLTEDTPTDVEEVVQEEEVVTEEPEVLAEEPEVPEVPEEKIVSIEEIDPEDYDGDQPFEFTELATIYDIEGNETTTARYIDLEGMTGTMYDNNGDGEFDLIRQDNGILIDPEGAFLTVGDAELDVESGYIAYDEDEDSMIDDDLMNDIIDTSDLDLA